MSDYWLLRPWATRQEVIEYLALHQAAQDFRLEVEHRAQVDAYCQWYYQVAEENRETLTRMQGELNVLAWFSRRSS